MIAEDISEVPTEYLDLCKNIIDFTPQKQMLCKLAIKDTARELGLIFPQNVVEMVALLSKDDLENAIKYVRSVGGYVLSRGIESAVITEDIVNKVLVGV